MKTCDAKTRGGSACGQKAGWGTPHVGTGRCKLHGGLSTGGSGAPAGNKRAVTTGEYETIFADCLEEDELAIYAGIETDLLQQLDEKIRLSDIRIRRMLARIQRLGVRAFTVVERSTDEEEGSGGDDDDDGDGYFKRKRSEKERATLGQIQDVEEALTRVKREHRQLLALKHQILQAQPPEDDVDVSGYVDAISSAAKKLDWPAEIATQSDSAEVATDG